MHEIASQIEKLVDEVTQYEESNKKLQL